MSDNDQDRLETATALMINLKHQSRREWRSRCSLLVREVGPASEAGWHLCEAEQVRKTLQDWQHVVDGVELNAFLMNVFFGFQWQAAKTAFERNVGTNGYPATWESFNTLSTITAQIQVYWLVFAYPALQYANCCFQELARFQYDFIVHVAERDQKTFWQFAPQLVFDFKLRNPKIAPLGPVDSFNSERALEKHDQYTLELEKLKEDSVLQLLTTWRR
ncbi:hypothetical protein CAOG_06546 [Capsaspora owczarzaki ATCC 30864]|uniref:hypothetical protein n=1 Tax=Capsaspora owczarzaki (strain ATCC 30864) TaxID=595528 RepID=UPI0001FE2FDD|nr:hypothetical protein CAOG_06546 [Capsaspora owczarzaki ATCC 30864]|eukprot:XP_004345295.1 hypothetical protein CAOG_06546 [Capsaspora owczarzaki ATCC 30864]